MTQNQIATTNHDKDLPVVGGWTIQDVISADEVKRMPMGLRIEFVPELRAHFEQMANDMATSELTREHLRGKPAECLSVIRNALNWNMDPRAVASKTYAPGKGTIGIEGVLAAAILMSSGRVRGLRYEYVGDWSRVQGKWAFEQLRWPDGNPKKYRDGKPIMGNVAKWKPEDEQGLAIIGIADMMDGTEVRTPEITLIECQPRNAQTWPSAPKRQIIHVAERALCNMICGDRLMGVHIDVGMTRTFDETPPIKNVTPVDPEKEGLVGTGEVEPGTPNGQVIEGEAETTKTRTRGKRISLTFRGKLLTQTNFLRDLRQIIARIDEDDEVAWEHLLDDIDTALLSIEDEADRRTIKDKVEPLVTPPEVGEEPTEHANPAHQGGLDLAEE